MKVAVLFSYLVFCAVNTCAWADWESDPAMHRIDPDIQAQANADWYGRSVIYVPHRPLCGTELDDNNHFVFNAKCITNPPISDPAIRSGYIAALTKCKTFDPDYPEDLYYPSNCKDLNDYWLNTVRKFYQDNPSSFILDYRLFIRAHLDDIAPYNYRPIVAKYEPQELVGVRDLPGVNRGDFCVPPIQGRTPNADLINMPWALRGELAEGNEYTYIGNTGLRPSDIKKAYFSIEGIHNDGPELNMPATKECPPISTEINPTRRTSVGATFKDGADLNIKGF